MLNFHNLYTYFLIEPFTSILEISGYYKKHWLITTAYDTRTGKHFETTFIKIHHPLPFYQGIKNFILSMVKNNITFLIRDQDQ